MYHSPTITYTSGDRYYNFSAYKKDLQYKYKIDPDLFYLIWYQQEVNQFAIMHPEERFRIFSEIHGIDKVQRDWEESIEKMKETEETLRSSELNVKLMKADLAMKKSALDRFLDNQKRLREGTEMYIVSLLGLEKHLHREKESIQAIIQQLEEKTGLDRLLRHCDDNDGSRPHYLPNRLPQQPIRRKQRRKKMISQKTC